MRRRIKRAGRAEEPERDDRWVVSYADFITLLFAFFTTMYAISTVDAGKLEMFSGSMRTAFKAAADGRPQQVIEGIEPVPPGDLAVEREAREQLGKFAIMEGVTVARDRRGVALRFEDSLLFGSGSADIRRSAGPLLDAAAAVIRQTQGPVVIEGHTDSLPLRGSRYASNWELSAARAVSVLRYFLGEQGLRPERFSASGYGEHRPLASNGTPEGRSKNRRVEILLVREGSGAYSAVH